MASTNLLSKKVVDFVHFPEFYIVIEGPSEQWCQNRNNCYFATSTSCLPQVQHEFLLHLHQAPVCSTVSVSLSYLLHSDEWGRPMGGSSHDSHHPDPSYIYAMYIIIKSNGSQAIFKRLQTSILSYWSCQMVVGGQPPGNYSLASILPSRGTSPSMGTACGNQFTAIHCHPPPKANTTLWEAHNWKILLLWKMQIKNHSC